MILDNINSPADLKNLSIAELTELSGELRKIITETVSGNGGHLASNLGMVDAEIALLRTFSLPEDRIVYDVGHQAYAHKLLTGRKERFATLRKNGGISGFTNRAESEYDTVTTGHSGTALSTAIGIAEANRLSGNGRWTVAVIGDGSFTNGMVYEAINQLHNKELKLIILLNDNTMSISKNVGGVSNYFSKIRTSRGYFATKMYLKRFFKAIPLIGNGIVRGIGAMKDFVKRLIGAETWFESLGIDYIGPGEGNDIEKMLIILEEAKQKNKPVVVHIMTEKGKGYLPAEEHPERYHSTSGFDLETGNSMPKKMTFTDAFSEILVREAGKNDGIVAITAAMADGCGLATFRAKWPERFFDVGIAEEHAVTFSAGLSIGGEGKVLPVLVLYSTFSQRVFDQLWHDFCLQNAEKNDLSMILMLSHGGIVPGDGMTHQGIFDTSLLSLLPGTVVWCPDTYSELDRIFTESEERKGLSVIRYPKAGENRYPAEMTDYGNFSYASFGDGSEVVISYGHVAENAVLAAKMRYEKDGAGVCAVVLKKIIPLCDDSEFEAIIEKASRITVVEESVGEGGVGKLFAAKYSGRKAVRAVSIDSPFVRCGDYEDVMKREGFDAENLACILGESF